MYRGIHVVELQFDNQYLPSDEIVKTFIEIVKTAKVEKSNIAI